MEFHNKYFEEVFRNLKTELEPETVESIFSFLDSNKKIYHFIEYIKLDEENYSIFHKRFPDKGNVQKCIIHKGRNYLLTRLGKKILYIESDTEDSSSEVNYSLEEKGCASIEVLSKVHSFLVKESDKELLEMLSFIQNFHSSEERKKRELDQLDRESKRALFDISVNKNYSERIIYYSKINYREPFDTVIDYLLQNEDPKTIIHNIEEMIVVNDFFSEVQYPNDIGIRAFRSSKLYYFLGSFYFNPKENQIKITKWNDFVQGNDVKKRIENLLIEIIVNKRSEKFLTGNPRDFYRVNKLRYQ